MIEENVINWIDLGETKQPLDIYGEKYKMNFFKLMMTIKLNNKSISSLDLILQIIFFIQFLTLDLYGITDKVDADKDYFLIIFKYLSNVFLIYDIADSSLTYTVLVIISFIITIIFISILIYLIICVNKEIKPLSIVLTILNILVLFEIYYIIGPIINISLTSIVCVNGNHIFLGSKCFSSTSHILVFIAGVISIIFHLFFSIFISIYYSDIGNMGDYGPMTRVNCNYEIYANLSIIFLFVVHFVLKFYLEQKRLYFIIWELVIFFFCTIFAIYIFKFVFFYKSSKNFIIHASAPMTLWFSLLVLLKQLLKLKDTTIFQIIGLFMIFFAIYIYLNIKQSHMITDFNIFDGKVLKDIEIFKYSLESLITGNTYSDKTLLYGYIHRFEEFLLSNPDLSGKYQKLKDDIYLNKKISLKTTISIYSIIYLTYSYHIEKSIEHSAFICINMCYFLINKLKNPTYAIFLLSEMKVKTHRQLYYKFLLMEQIKEHLISKITYSSNKESIKHVEIGSIILYNIYCTLFRLKIYDATSIQIDYFDNFKSSVTTKKSTENFLKNGEDILKLKQKIMKIWSQLTQLNPFNDSEENDYMLYLKTILQDDFLAKSEEKKNIAFKNKHLRFKNNTYFSMYCEEQSSFLLIDGANDANLKILYTTPNFTKLFLFSGKEMLNTSVNDLIPNAIQKHHKEFVDDAIKYSNLNHMFKKSKDVLVKTKNNGLININLYVKCVPNLSFGLNYMAYLNKIKDKNFIIILDKDLKINGFTEDFGSAYNSDPENFIINGNNFGLTQSVIGHHIGMVIPDILLILTYYEKRNCFYIEKLDTELKGYLYPINPWKEIEHRVDYLLDKIKNKNKNSNKINDETEINNVIRKEYETIIGDINKKFPNPVSVFYKITVHSFLRNTFKYYRIYITNDLIKANQVNSKENSLSNFDEDEHFSRLKWRATTITIDKKEIKKKKEIKLSIDSIKEKNNRNNENDLIEGEEKKENNEDNPDNNNIDDNKKIKENANINSFNMRMFEAGRENKKNENNLLQIASADEAKFNRLKKNIVDNEETFIIFYMKLINLIFALLSIFFIIYDSIINKNNIENMDKFLNENLIFNHSKISVGMLYLESTFYKYLMEEYLDNTACLTGDCKDIYIEQIIFCVDDMREQKDKFDNLYSDFANKITVKEYLNITNKKGSEEIEVNMEFMMNLLINYSLRIKEANQKIKEFQSSSMSIDDKDYNESLKDYNENMEKLNISLINLIEQSNALESIDINGFSGKEKIEKINKLFNPFPISLVVMIIFIVLLISIFFFFIYYLYTYEVFFIQKLIDFNNPKYELYLKQLEELKKKLRNENEDDDDEDKEDDLGFGTGIGTKRDEDSQKNKIKDNKEKNDEDKKDKDDQKKLKRMRGKGKSKLQHQQKKKKTIMRNFFLRINLFFCIKIFILAFLGLTYYIFSTAIKSSMRTDYLEIEDITDETEGIYKESLDNHIFLLRKIKNLTDYTNLKEELKRNGEVTVNNKIYKVENMNLFVNDIFPTIEIPDINGFEFPKLGNLLMPIVSSANDNSNSIHSQFNELYNGDACKFLFPELGKSYEKCSEFWNGIIAKGMEQSLTQLSVALTSVLDDLKALNVKGVDKENVTRFLDSESHFYKFQTFIEYYFYLAYLKTSQMFNILRKDIVKDIKNKFDILLILYLIVSIILFGLILLFVYSIRSYFNSFLNFVAIFPLKFLIEDENLFRQCLRLNDNLFR